MPPTNSRPNLQFFRYLPSEIVTDILSRLPIRAIVTCKCVCRSWRDLLLTRDFADFHLSKSVPGIVIGPSIFNTPEDLRFVEFDDVLGIELQDLHCKPLTGIESTVLPGSPNGLLLLQREVSGNKDAIYICNPITRAYIKLPYDRLVYSSSAIHSYGFGLSRMTGQRKVVRIYHECYSRAQHRLANITLSICLVYTLGTVKWRSIIPPAPFVYDYRSIGVYLNGNLHWMLQVLDGSHCISCFDLEKETFSTFSLPTREILGVSLVALVDGLCVCHSSAEVIDIWLMKEYGDDKSWTKEFVIRKSPDLFNDDFVQHEEVVHPVKIFRDGDILMAWQNWQKTGMIHYSNKTRITRRIQVDTENVFSRGAKMAMPHTPSFFSLGSFAREKVSRF